jgi:hypothetical protein
MGHDKLNKQFLSIFRFLTFKQNLQLQADFILAELEKTQSASFFNLIRFFFLERELPVAAILNNLFIQENMQEKKSFEPVHVC